MSTGHLDVRASLPAAFVGALRVEFGTLPSRRRRRVFEVAQRVSQVPVTLDCYLIGVIRVRRLPWSQGLAGRWAAETVVKISVTVELLARIHNAFRDNQIRSSEGAAEANEFVSLDPDALSFCIVRAKKAKSNHGADGVPDGRRNRLPLDLVTPVDVALLKRTKYVFVLVHRLKLIDFGVTS